MSSVATTSTNISTQPTHRVVCAYAATNADGTPLWPDVFTPSILDNKRKENPLAFARQYLNQAAPNEGATLKREWLHYYLYKDLPPLEDMFRMLVIDPSASEDADADFFAAAELARAATGQAFLIAVYRERATVPTQLKLARQLGEGPFHPHLVKVETGTLRGLFDMLVETTQLPVQEVKPKGPKSARIISMAPRFEARHILLPGVIDGIDVVPSEAVTPFVEQWSRWPNVKNDDLLDAVAMGVDEIFTGVEGALEFSDSTQLLVEGLQEGQEANVLCPKCHDGVTMFKIRALGKSMTANYFEQKCPKCGYSKTFVKYDDPAEEFAVADMGLIATDGMEGEPVRRQSYIWS